MQTCCKCKGTYDSCHKMCAPLNPAPDFPDVLSDRAAALEHPKAAGMQFFFDLRCTAPAALGGISIRVKCCCCY